jgi:hypothetical protein
MAKKVKRLSKSKYLIGLQCPKALWLSYHRKDLQPEVDEHKQHVFDTGNEVGKLATKYFKGGIEITEGHRDIDKAIESTNRAVENGEKHIFEATACSIDGAFSRIDILNKVNKGSDAWDLVEVKASNQVKDYHIDDMAFQRYAFTNAGYKIRKSILMHLNGEYVRSGDVDLKALFELEDCTEDVEERMEEIKENVQDFLKTINSDQEPLVDISGQCKNPFKCDFFDYCWRDIPDYSVYNIFSGKKLKALLDANILDVSDVQDWLDCTDRQFAEIDAYKKNRIIKEIYSIKNFLSKLEYPLYYLDYETISPAVPMFDNSSPYQLIPFQFSLHIQEKKGGELEHVDFLHTRNDDPRPDLIEALIENCGEKGSVVVYNQSFEEGINKELGTAFFEHKDSLHNINERMVDLLEPFDKRYLYHPKMKGSASLKSVLPAFVKDLSYDGLEIEDGMTASIKYYKWITGCVPDNAKENIFQNLKKYCELDTLAEVRLIDVLYKAL